MFCVLIVLQLYLQVLDILRSTELFTPHLEMKGRSEDPVTTDLVGALLLVKNWPNNLIFWTESQSFISNSLWNFFMEAY